MTDTIAGILILIASFFAVIAALGLVRMPDVLIRMHGSTKIGTLACGLTMVGAAVYFGTAEITIRANAIVLLLLLTAPIAAHMIGRSVISTGVPLWKAGDSELAEDVQEAVMSEGMPGSSEPPPIRR